MVFGMTSLITMEPEAMTAPSPMVTPFKMMERIPIQTWLPITIGARLGRPPSTS